MVRPPVAPMAPVMPVAQAGRVAMAFRSVSPPPHDLASGPSPPPSTMAAAQPPHQMMAWPRSAAACPAAGIAPPPTAAAVVAAAAAAQAAGVAIDAATMASLVAGAGGSAGAPTGAAAVARVAPARPAQPKQPKAARPKAEKPPKEKAPPKEKPPKAEKPKGAKGAKGERPRAVSPSACAPPPMPTEAQQAAAAATAPKSKLFGEPAEGASASRAAAPPSEYWNVHGMVYRIPPLYDQLGLQIGSADAPPQGYESYAQWVRSVKGGPSAAPMVRQPPGRQPGSAAGSKANAAATAAALAAAAAAEEEALKNSGPGGAEEADEARWRRAYGVVVKRDINKQQRVFQTQQRDAQTTLKRTALAVQKEVRRRAMNVQRIAASSRVQLRCKRMVRDLGAAHKVREAALLAERKAALQAEWRRRRDEGA